MPLVFILCLWVIDTLFILSIALHMHSAIIQLVFKLLCSHSFYILKDYVLSDEIAH